MEREFKNTDFFIEDIDESVKDLAVNDTSVTHVPANTDFFIENIDNNVMEIAVDRGLTPDVVEVVPANTDFFIENIDSNVIKIATNLGITPTTVTKVPANTDFFIENIYYNLILICEELNIEPFEITRSPINTDFFIEAIATNVEKIMDAQTEKHVNGSFINITLSADSEITEYELDGDATQNGTPTPDAPVAVNTVTGEQNIKVTGKNLFSGEWTQFDNQGGQGSLYAYFKLPSNEAYSLTLIAKNDVPSQSPANKYIGFSNSGGGESGSNVNWLFTTGSTATKGQVLTKHSFLGYISMYPKNEATLQWFLDNFEVMLEKGEQYTSYESYTSQSQEINLGKNLFDPTIYEEGYLATNGGVSSPTSNEERTSGFIKVFPNTTYTFEIFETSTTFTEWLAYCEYTAPNQSTFISPRYVKTGASPATGFYTFTTSANAQYIRVSARNMKYATKFQVSMGGRTTYAPYFTPIELAGVGKKPDGTFTYQDGFKHDKTTGKWYIEKQVGKIVIDGSINEYAVDATLTNTTRLRTLSFSTEIRQATTVPTLICDYFEARGNWNTDVVGISFANSNGNIWFRASKSTIGTTNESVLSWLTSHPVTLYYALETPTTTEITDETLIEQLEAVYDLELKEGVVNIVLTATSPNLPAILKATIKPIE